MRLSSVFAIAVLALPPAAHGAAAAPRDEPRLATTASEGGANRLWFELRRDGSVAVRRQIRETAATLGALETGGDPGGNAYFAAWTENGERWSAFSRDAGVTWSRARPLRDDLRLLSASVPPGAAMPPPRSGLALPEDGRLFIVQLKSVSLPEWRAALEDQRAEVVASFANNAHVVRGDPAAARALSNLQFVERAEPFHPHYRLEPALLAWLDGAGDALEADGRLRVRVVALQQGPVAKGRIALAAQDAGATVVENWPNGPIVELSVDRAQLRRLAAHDDVMWIDRWSPPATDMDLVREDAGTNWLESNYGYCGQGVRGEVLDQGIKADHWDFDGVMFHGPNDLDSHGTSTYGIVFGNGNRDGDGNAQATGNLPCPQAQGIFADFNFLGDRFAHTQALKQSPYFASFQSNSWGHTTTSDYNSFSVELDGIIWQLDFALVQSQSNTGNTSSRPQAWAKNAISVGGIYHFGTLDTSDDGWLGGASIGPAADGRVKPDVHYWYDRIFTTDTSVAGYTTSFCCTSAATPQVAGVLGLMVQLWSENAWGTNPTGSTVFERQPHFSTIKALVINNAQQYPFNGTGDDLTRVHQGWGRPSVRLAKERAGNSLVVNESVRLEVGESANYAVQVAPGEAELKITMVYPDPPGVAFSSVHRINDVDLTVTSPSSVVYHGNVGLLAGNYSTPGGSPNPIDTVENVFVLSPEAGTWLVEVEAADVAQDAVLGTPEPDVTFALVVTGGDDVPSVCGNGVREGVEACDGADFGGTSCLDEGCLGGTVSCTPGCVIDASACTACPSCNLDSTCDSFEDCVNCAADCPPLTLATCGNDVCETADGEDCVTCPQDCNSQTGGNPNLRFCCSDGSGPQYAVPCAEPRCTANGNTCSSFPAPLSCCGDGTCEGAEFAGNCFPDCGPRSPGEAGASPAGDLMVTGYDPSTGTLSLSYGAACAAASHVLEYGELTHANVAAYAWSGQQCGVGTSGSYAWNVGALPDSLFFVVVGQNGAYSGSYGKDRFGLELPEDTTSTACPAPQDLFRRCD
jgi:hypothetical protein